MARANHRLPLERLTVQWWAALEAAQTALHSATRYVDSEAVAAKIRRLTEERAEISQLLQALALELRQTAAPKLDGVTASVNYATENASVDYDADAAAPEALLDAVAAAGHDGSAASPAPKGSGLMIQPWHVAFTAPVREAAAGDGHVDMFPGHR